MSIVVNNVTKVFGDQHAVDQLSFTARKGNITGFLGPNGAGKSTTMKMIVGYIEATTGNIEVCGLDVAEDSIAVKKKIGYLPEHNPLYHNMYVKEYLNFVAGFLPSSVPKKQRVAEVIEQTGLGVEQHKQIKLLSKGYKQRVGLAQAIYHDPEVLILDEPTSGLDPNQLVEIRHLIKELGRDKTVILSTHIMQEVNALCDQVLIINKGSLILDEKLNHIQASLTANQAIQIELLNPINHTAFDEINGVVDVQSQGNNAYMIYYNKEDIRKDIFNKVVKNNGVILSMQKKEMSMEEVFQKLTNEI